MPTAAAREEQRAEAREEGGGGAGFGHGEDDVISVAASVGDPHVPAANGKTLTFLQHVAADGKRFGGGDDDRVGAVIEQNRECTGQWKS